MSYSNLRKVIYKMLDNSYSTTETAARLVKFLSIDISDVKEYDIDCNFNLDDEDKTDIVAEGLKSYFTLNLFNGETIPDADGEIRTSEYTFDSAVSNLSYQDGNGVLNTKGEYRIYKKVNDNKINFYIGFFNNAGTIQNIKKFDLRISVNYGIIDSLDYTEDSIGDKQLISVIDFTKITSAVATHPILAQVDNKDYYLTGTEYKGKVSDVKTHSIDALSVKRDTTNVEFALNGNNSRKCIMEFDGTENAESFRIYWN